MKASLLLRLATRPAWLLANAVNLGAFGLQLLALRRGSLLVVQPILVTALLFALPMGAALARQRLTRREWTGAVGVVMGLAIFLTVANPGAGDGSTTARGWAVIALAIGLPAVLQARAGGRSEATRRAVYLGAASGIIYGVTAAVTKASAHLLDGGVWRTLGSWPPYALASLALLGLVLSQSAFQAGALKSSLPLLVLGEPAVAAAIGILVFHERFVASGPLALLELAAVAAMAAGVVLLARSPQVLATRAA